VISRNNQEITFIKWYECKIIPLEGMRLHDGALNHSSHYASAARITAVDIAPYSNTYHVYLEDQFVKDFQMAEEHFISEGLSVKTHHYSQRKSIMSITKQSQHPIQKITGTSKCLSLNCADFLGVS
jgi:hypothetical protein